MADRCRTVYLLGAGASYGVGDIVTSPLEIPKGRILPVISEMGVWFDHAQKVLESYADSVYYQQKQIRIDYLTKKPSLDFADRITDKYRMIYDAIGWLRSECADYISIDNYANVLFSRNQGSDDADLFKLKGVLSICLDIWQHNGKVDKRYVSLISKYLKGRGSEQVFDPSIRFVSWNYDRQVEMAFARFKGSNFDCTFNYMDAHYKFLSCGVKRPSLIKLNGTAGIVNSFGGVTSLVKVNEFDSVSAANLKSLAEYWYDTALSRRPHRNALSFAWETDDNSDTLNTAMSQAATYFSEADDVVVIGYSFPDYNTSIDHYLFDLLKKGCVVHVQDPSAVQVVDRIRPRFPGLKFKVHRDVTDFWTAYK